MKKQDDEESLWGKGGRRNDRWNVGRRWEKKREKDEENLWTLEEMRALKSRKA